MARSGTAAQDSTAQGLRRRFKPYPIPHLVLALPGAIGISQRLSFAADVTKLFGVPGEAPLAFRRDKASRRAYSSRMPELPEVEIYRRYFDAHALGQRIDEVEVRDRRILHRTTAPALARSLTGRTFGGTLRHGKHLFADAGGTWLYLHFGMSGDLYFGNSSEEAPRFTRVLLRFEKGSFLAFEDMRLFGRAGIVADPAAFILQHRLGPDPLRDDFTSEVFLQLLAGRRGAIKSLLMDQRNIAGLGNLWVDEILFQSALHPKTPAERIGEERGREMFSAMRRILLTAIDRQERGRNHPRNYLIGRRREDGPCPRCGGEISRAVVFGRTTYYCSRHQPKPREVEAHRVRRYPRL